MSASGSSLYETLILESNDKQRTVDLKLGAVSIDYYEDIFSPTITAKIRVINTGDSIEGEKTGKLQSIYNGLPLRGGERVRMKVLDRGDGKKGLDFASNSSKYLFVSSITDVISESQTESFLLNLVSREAITNETTRVARKYTGTIDQSVSKILKDVLQTTKFDSDDIKELEIDSLRNKIGLVSQDIFLFEGTVFENIAYGNLNASEEEVWEAARLSESDKFINLLPKKEKTIVGERGQKLSGGQRQRISIARAILKNPEILILDEATSAVDNETEAAIQRSINTLKKGRTVIAIAHRLSTIRNAEIIYVLEDGRIVESGNHESLLDIKGIYSKLWSVQTGEKIS